MGMTIDEAIFCEKSYIGETNCVDCKYYGTETCQSRESHKMAIKALEQDPTQSPIIDWNNCHTSEQLDSIATTKNDLGVNAVSRQVVIDTIFEECSGTKLDIDFAKVLMLQRAIKALPPVTPQEPRKGHWIENAPQYDMLNPQYICSECGNAHTRTTPYCEICGAKMESEDK